METVVNLWWGWMIGAVVTFLYGAYNQASRMNRMMTNAKRKGTAAPFWLLLLTDLRSHEIVLGKHPETNFFQGIYALFIAAVLHLAFVVMLVTSIVLNIITYAKQ